MGVKFRPTPEGVIVTGVRSGQPWIERCIGHVYLTHEPIKNTKWQSGYQQGATCLVCDVDVYPMDASWWIERATAKQIRIAGKHVHARIRSLTDNYDLLKRTYLEKRKTH